jgi:cardiolipin synthase A/B
MKEEMGWKFYLTGKAAQAGMLKACLRANETIDVEQYIFEDDELGRRFAAVLMTKARAGLRVRVLCDTIGSNTLFVSSLSDEMRAAGVQLQFFNPIEAWWLHKSTQWFLRDHRKILIIDRTEAYTGGVGISKIMEDWRDTHVMVTGSVVHHFEIAFERMWDRTAQRKRLVRVPTPPVLTGTMALFTNAPYRHQRFIYYQMLDALRRAENYVYLSTPYFVPDRKLFRALRRAVKRGVDVRLLLPRHADSPFVDLASRSYYWLALRNGVKLYRYTPSFMHAKTMVVDDEWATVGSSNLDNLSLLLNYEANLICIEKDFVKTLRKHFEADLKEAEQLTSDGWHSRPLGYKLLELLTWPLHRLM